MSAFDADSINLDKFDEDDPQQHQMKMLFGFGTFAAFRGFKEHHALCVSNITRGTYPLNFEDKELAGLKYIGVSTIGNLDKTHWVSVHNNYTRDTTNVFRFPITNEPSNFGVSIVRYLKKLEPGTVKFYCKVALPTHLKVMRQMGYPDVRYYKNRQLGKQKITELFKAGARLLELSDPDGFKPQSLRGVCITRMVNSENVSTAETMRYARHRSVAASKMYQRTDGISEGNRLRAIGLMGSGTSSVAKGRASSKLPEESEEEDEEFVDLMAGYNSNDDKISTGPTVRKLLLEEQEAKKNMQNSKNMLGFMTQKGIDKLKDNMIDLRKEMAEIAVPKQAFPTSSYANKNLPESTNNRIVKDLISQVEELRIELKRKKEEEMIYESRENDFEAECEEHKRDLWKLRKELAEVKRENVEMFNSICRSEERMKKNVPPPGTSYKKKRRGGSCRYDGRGVDDSSDDDHDDDVFERKRRRR